MPTIASFDGIMIYMYWQEHGVPHLHAVHGDRTAVYSIESGEIIVGALRRRAKRLVKRWIAERREELLDNWRRGRDGLPFVRIPGPGNDR